MNEFNQQMNTEAAPDALTQEAIEQRRRRRDIRESLDHDIKNDLEEARQTVYAILNTGSCLDEDGVRQLAMQAGLIILSPARHTKARRAYEPEELLLKEGEAVPSWLGWNEERGRTEIDFPELSRRLIEVRGIELNGTQWLADGKETNEGGIRRIVKDVLDIVLPRSGHAVEEAVRALKTDAQLKNARLFSVCSRGIRPERQKFLYAPWFPLGKLTILQADGGTGKTTFMCTLAALLSKGASLAGSECSTGPANSLLVSTEDDPGELSAKLIAADADRNRVFISNGFCTDGTTPMSFMDAKLEDFIRDAEAKLVVFDPFQSFLGTKTDMNRANETRPILARLAGIAERQECAIVLLCHLGKTQKDAIYGALGSVDITAAARSGLHLMRDPRQPEREADVLCFHFKHNNSPMGKTIRFHIDDEGCARILGAEDETIGSLTREIRKRELADEAAERRAKKAEGDREAAEHAPLLPVLRQLLRENPDGIAVSGADLVDCVFRMHGHCPYTQDSSAASVGCEVRRLMPSLLREGWETHSQVLRPLPFRFQGILMQGDRKRASSVRGFRFTKLLSEDTQAMPEEDEVPSDGFSFAGEEAYA